MSERSDVVDLAQALLAEGLVVRTWGNVSHRVEGDSYVVTPTGRNYNTMIESDLALIDKEGNSSGPFKPSGEHGLHGICYRQRPAKDAVVHTHQPYASAMSLSGSDIVLTPEEAAILGQPRVPIAGYGMPGTKTLHNAVEQVLIDRPDDNIILLEAHGTFMCADSAEHGLELGKVLESAAKRAYEKFVPAASPAPESDDDVAYSVRGHSEVRYFSDQDERVTPNSATAVRHQDIYRNRKNVQTIRVCRDAEVAQFYGKTLDTYLDDYAQLVGVRANQGTRANVVLLEDQALCLGKDTDDAEAVEIVLRKNVRAARVAQISGATPIATWECVLMNAVYKLKYSKQY